MRRKLIELKSQRTTLLENAEALLKEGKQAEYRAEMEKVANMNGEISDVEKLLEEQDRKFMERGKDPAEEKDKALERADILRKGGEVKFSARETMRDVYQASKQVTLATGSIVQPTGAGSNIRDPLGNVVCSVVDEVYVQDLTGMGAYLEPYVISEIDAKGGKATTNAGKARTASTDPTFGVQVPTSIEGVPSELLIPANTWEDQAAYEASCRKLAASFVENFKKYTRMSAEVVAAGPKA